MLFLSSFGTTHVPGNFSRYLWPRGLSRAAGMLSSHQFPVNYFSVSEVEQWFPDFEETYTEEGSLPGDSSYW